MISVNIIVKGHNIPYKNDSKTISAPSISKKRTFHRTMLLMMLLNTLEYKSQISYNISF